MIIKNVPKKLPTDQPQVQISGVADGDVYNHAVITNKLAQVASAEAGVTVTIEIAPVPPVPPASTPAAPVTPAKA